MNDAALYGDPKISDYISTRVEYSSTMEIPDGEGTTNAYISTYIMRDDSHRDTVRNVNTIPMAISDSGGFMTIIFMATMIIVQRLQNTIYYTTLIKSFYHYQEETPESID
jgi:hypothetical protein